MKGKIRMTRDEFRNQVFKRDQHKCVVPDCSLPAVDAHHIIDRALWLKTDPTPEGYIPDNGASLCEYHHKLAEKNVIPPQALRNWIGLETALPAQFDPEKIYDKWGEVLGSCKHTGMGVKYPSTPYFEFSPHDTDKKDLFIKTEQMVGKPLVIQIKMDGSNCCLTREHVAARNGSTADHHSFSPLKSIHAHIKDQIPYGIQIMGEWLFAKHSIPYVGDMAVADFLQVFAVYDLDHDLFLSYAETQDICRRLRLTMVPCVSLIEHAETWALNNEIYNLFSRVVKSGHEGIVAKSIYPFHGGQFEISTAKMVRKGHVQTDVHWSKHFVPNESLRPITDYFK